MAKVDRSNRALAGEVFDALGIPPIARPRARQPLAFDVEALPLNRQGRLAPQQLGRLTAANRELRQMLAVGGAALAVFSAVAFASGGTSWEILDRSEPAYIWGLGSLLALLACLPFAIRWQRRSRDLRAGNVRIIEGATRKVTRMMGAGDKFEKVRYLYADRARFRASPEVYAAAPASGRIRLFVVGSPDEVVNFEALA